MPKYQIPFQDIKIFSLYTKILLMPAVWKVLFWPCGQFAEQSGHVVWGMNCLHVFILSSCVSVVFLLSVQD
jgi:hypothetical protein